MPRFRKQKIDSEIQYIISKIINENFGEEIKFAVINYVSTAKDLSITNIYIRFAIEDQQSEFDKLIKKIHIIQSDFGKKIHLRITPKINFILDSKQKQINKIESLLDRIKNENKK
jgi:ribosome-binding factor A